MKPLFNKLLFKNEKIIIFYFVRIVEKTYFSE